MQTGSFLSQIVEIRDSRFLPSKFPTLVPSLWIQRSLPGSFRQLISCKRTTLLKKERTAFQMAPRAGKRFEFRSRGKMGRCCNVCLIF